MQQGISGQACSKFAVGNFIFAAKSLRGKSFGKVLEWYVAVKQIGLGC